MLKIRNSLQFSCGSGGQNTENQKYNPGQSLIVQNFSRTREALKIAAPKFPVQKSPPPRFDRLISFPRHRVGGRVRSGTWENVGFRESAELGAANRSRKTPR